MPICLLVTSNLSSSAALIPFPPFPPFPYHFPASSWQVISCCRGNITGSPAGFTLRSGILPQAVESINTQRSLAGFGSQKSLVFLTSQLSFCHPPVSTHQSIMIHSQASNKQASISIFLLLIRVQTDFAITHFGSFNDSISNQRLKGKDFKRGNNSEYFT